MDNDYKNEDLNVYDEGISFDDDEENTSNSDNNGNKKHKVKKRGGNRNKIIAAIVGLAVIIGLFSFIQYRNGVNKERAAESAQKIKTSYKVGIQPTVKAQSSKQSLNERWREATLDYAQGNDRDKYRNALNDINKDRINTSDTISDSKSVVAKDVQSALNVMHTELNKAYNAKDSKEAVDIYNSWNDNDKKSNKKYVKDFTSELKKRDISYKVNNKDGQGSQISY